MGSPALPSLNSTKWCQSALLSVYYFKDFFIHFFSSFLLLLPGIIEEELPAPYATSSHHAALSESSYSVPSLRECRWMPVLRAHGPERGRTPPPIHTVIWQDAPLCVGSRPDPGYINSSEGFSVCSWQNRWGGCVAQWISPCKPQFPLLWKRGNNPYLTD